MQESRRILTDEGTEISIADVNLEKGTLREDRVFVQHHEAQEKVEQQSHYELVEFFPETGGCDVKVVIDVPAQPASEAHDEYEDIFRFISYSEEELAETEAAELRGILEQAQYLEGDEIKEARKKIEDRIKELEAKLCQTTRDTLLQLANLME